MSISPDEYSCLRSEIVEHVKQIDGLMKFAVTAPAGLIALGVTIGGNAGVIITVLPLILLLPVMTVILNRRFNIARIAAYLRAFADTGFQYENRLYSFRKELQKKNKISWPNYSEGIIGTLLLEGFLCIAISFILSVKNLYHVVALPIICCIFWIIISFHYWRKSSYAAMGGELDSIMFEQWREIKKKEALSSKVGE